jgi:4-amino-4-deoxy-L-arabinose transferase-like glycosyltransferase
MTRNDRPLLTAALLWTALVASALLFRPPLPIDETRYLSVAWEMWRTHGFLVPRLNGVPYAEKPPLLFHLIHAGWFLSGVQEWTARLTAPAFAFAGIVLTARLARLLWPERRDLPGLVPFALLALPLWAVFGTMTMFDTVLTSFVLLGVAGLLLAARDGGPAGWILCGAALGGGLLAKGPVILLHVLPPGILAPLWRGDGRGASWGRWYAGLLAATAGGIAAALFWALPAAREGGEAYGRAILWGQTTGRMVRSFAHGRPLWWYLPLLPAVLFPWGLRPGMWRVVWRDRGDPGIRFCLAWGIPALALLSLVSGKQVHYLIPILPAAALLAARTAHSDPGAITRRFHWTVAAFSAAVAAALILLPHLDPRSSDMPPLQGLPTLPLILPLLPGLVLLTLRPADTAAGLRTAAAGMVALIVLLYAGPVRTLAPAFDLTDAGVRIARIQERGGTVAVWPAKYAGQFSFAGRLEAPLVPLADRGELDEWMDLPGNSAVVVTLDRDKALPGRTPAYVQPFRGEWLMLYCTPPEGTAIGDGHEQPVTNPGQ